MCQKLSVDALSKSRLCTAENKLQENKDLKLVFTLTKSENKTWPLTKLQFDASLRSIVKNNISSTRDSSNEGHNSTLSESFKGIICD